jgi:hypothetical protein
MVQRTEDMLAVQYTEQQVADRDEEIIGVSRSRAVHSGKLILLGEIA